MAYPGTHMLLSFGGPLFSGEQWSCGLRSTPNFGDGSQFNQGALDDIVPVLGAWWSALTVVQTSAKLGWAKFNRIGSDGKYVSDESFTHFWEPVLSTSGTSPTLPPQVALAVTLETGVQRGLAARGRIFLPVVGGGLDVDGRISESAAGLVATQVANLLTSLNGIATYGVTSVYSDVREGAVRPITGVSCGRVLDTMRSRRNQITEERPPAVTVGGT